MSQNPKQITGSQLSRRSFIRAGAASAAALGVTKQALHAAEPSNTINVAVIGCGLQGETLIRALQKVTSVPYRFIAVCDILNSKAKSMAARLGLKNGNDYYGYTDAEAMLKAHPEINAVFIAAPDWVHHHYTEMCHAAGKDVYCEKMMSNTLEFSQRMVKSQRSSGKLLQIGHQRRSNPRYLYAKNQIMKGLNVTGTLTHAYAQWNRGVTPPIAPKYPQAEVEAITKAGYKDVFEFANWRWFAKYGGGPLSDLGAHQIDIFNWMFDAVPKAVTASGGTDFFKNRTLRPGLPPLTYEHPDNAIAIYEYDVPGHGLVRAVYQVLTTNSSMTAYEKYMGINGTVVIAEVDSYNQVYREKWDEDIAKWEGQFFGKGYLKKSAASIHHKFWQRPNTTWYRPDPWLDKEGVVDVRASTPLDPYELPVTFNLPYHTPHVENFLKVVAAKGKQSDLNCPVEDAYKCAVAVFKVNDLISQGGGRVEFKPEEFVVA